MSKYKRWAALVILIVTIAGGGLAIVTAGAIGWTATGPSTINKVGELPPNVLPSKNNIDCDSVTTRMVGTSTVQPNCVVQTAYGLQGNAGTVFTGSTEGIPVTGPRPFGNLYGVPNQSLAYTYVSPPTPGMYMYFYRSLLGNLKYEYANNRWQYTKQSQPEISLQNKAGNRYYVHTANIAFSANGNWMIADAMDSGFIRVNMATFEITAFAMSPNISTLYGLRGADVAISNNGRYAAIKPHDYGQLKIYDIGACQNTETPVKPQTECPSRDYWNDMSAEIPNFYRAHRPRFINDSQVSFQAMYDVKSGVGYKVAQYILTAPGANPSGIEYLGMGDSFASGQGAFNYMLGTDTANNKCHLSSNSYPYLLSSSLFSSGRSVACSGAKTRDIIDPSPRYEGQVKDRIIRDDRDNIDAILLAYQPGYLVQNEFVQKHNPQAVTLSIGGNDVGFSDVIKQCVMPSLKASTCFSTYEDQEELKRRLVGVGERLKTTYRTVSGPGRRIYVVGYPQIVIRGGNCAANVHLNDQEIRLFIDLTDTFNQVIKRAAESVGAQYVDVSDAFAGHRMCETKSSQVAVNGFTIGDDDGPGNFKFVGAESYHPNALGHRLLELAIRGRTNNLKAPTAASVNTQLVVADIPSAFPYAETPKTGRTINHTVHDSAIIPDVITPGIAAPIKVDASSVVLKPATQYQIKLDDDPTAVALVTTDASGILADTFSLPADVSCGYHTIHMFGQNIANQPTDIFKVVYVAAPDGDCNNGGTSSCSILPQSGKDLDKDGIDDACDAHIGDPPTYHVTITGSSIHAVKPH